MRFFISHIVVLSLLFVSLEGATDVVMDGVPHGDDVSHLSEFGHALEDDDGSVPDTESLDEAEKIASSCPFIASIRVYELRSK